ncbi:MAG: pyridoxal-phosphate dependent enzyme, partial [Anaerolineae bacterium]|nr:pyridoxal-phosphate dependent enzyme [Anaerolineae bacterium]
AAQTLAEGLEGDIESGSITLDMCRRYADKILLVDEALIAENIRWMLEHHNWVIEGAAAVGIAALRSGQIPADEKVTAVMISGGNLDYSTLQSLLR